MEAFVGEIRLLPYNFAPLYWLPCAGQILPIKQYPALFSIISTLYGGDGTTTFALPNLMSSVPQGAGQGPGLDATPFASYMGAEQARLGQNNYPPHNHQIVARTGSEASNSADEPGANAFLAQPRAVFMYSQAGSTETLATGTLSTEGTGTGDINRSLMQPYQAVAYCICVDGEVPIKP